MWTKSHAQALAAAFVANASAKSIWGATSLANSASATLTSATSSTICPVGDQNTAHASAMELASAPTDGVVTTAPVVLTSESAKIQKVFLNQRLFFQADGKNLDLKRYGDSAAECSGNGDCNCGKCECKEFPGIGKYTGRYCENFNSKCEQHEDCAKCLANAFFDDEDGAILGE